MKIFQSAVSSAVVFNLPAVLWSGQGRPCFSSWQAASFPKWVSQNKSAFRGQISLENTGMSKIKQAFQTFNILMCSQILQDPDPVLPKHFFHQSFLLEYSKDILLHGTHFGKRS